MGLPSDFPPRSGPARNAYLLAAIDDGRIVPVWRALTVTGGGHTATFFVLADALKLDGVRLSTSAYNLQQIADKLKASLMTPRIIDWAFLKADVAIPPQTIYPPDDSVAALEKESQKIDEAIWAATGGIGATDSQLVAPLGKNWVVSNALLGAKLGHAALYGWAMVRGYKPPVGVFPRPGTLLGISNIQPLATPHDMNYTDYAMESSLVRRDAVLDGRPVDIWSLMQSPDPSIVALVSHEGPLKILRQPGVPVLPPIAGPVSTMTSGNEYKSSLPWGYAKNGKPLHLGTQAQLRQYEEHLEKKHKKERESPVKSGFHKFFWQIVSIPLTTVAGIVIGKVIEKHRAKP